jgi:hypothetical protein
MGGEKPVKNGEKSSQLMKNQILATHVQFSVTTRSLIITSIPCRRIFHLMSPPFCTSLSRRSSLLRRRTLHITPIVLLLVLVLDPAVWHRPPFAVAPFGRLGILRQHRGVRRSSAAFPPDNFAFCIFNFELASSVHTSSVLHFPEPSSWRIPRLRYYNAPSVCQSRWTSAALPAIVAAIRCST